MVRLVISFLPPMSDRSKSTAIKETARTAWSFRRTGRNLIAEIVLRNRNSVRSSLQRTPSLGASHVRTALQARGLHSAPARPMPAALPIAALNRLEADRSCAPRGDIGQAVSYGYAR